MSKLKKSHSLIIIFFVLISFIIPYVATLKTLESNNASNSNEFIALLEKEIPRKLQAYRLPGAAVALAENGKLIWENGFTNVDVNKGISITSNTAFQAASISKPVTAWAIMKLIEEGKLDLDTPINTYLSRWKLPPSNYDNKVTIRKILSHTAGLSVNGYKGYEPDSILPTLEESLLGALNSKYKVEVKYEPGSKYSYSGGGYTILQLIIEEVTGMPFSSYMKNYILKPLGMNSSSYFWDIRTKQIAATGHGDYGQVLPDYVYTEKAAAGLYTTVHDLITFILANCSYNFPQIKQPILKPETIKLMHKKVYNDLPFGFGFMITSLENGIEILEHRGTNRGWRNKILFEPKKGDGIAILTNSDMGRDLQYDIELMWQKWKYGVISEELKDNLKQRIIIDFITIMLALILILYIIKAILRMSKKKHRFILRKSEKMSLIEHNSLIIPLSSIFYWWLIFYSSYILRGWVVATFVTIRFANISIMFVLWCLFIVLNRFFIEMEIE